MIDEKKDEFMDKIKNEIINLSKRNIIDSSNQNESEKTQKDFDQSFVKLTSTDPNIINESITNCASILFKSEDQQINVTHQHLEFLLLLSINVGRNNELHEKILSFASLILMRFPKLGIEIVDSDAVSQFIELFSYSMSKNELNFFDNLFLSSFDVFESINNKFHLMKLISNSLNYPEIPCNDFLNLLRLITAVIGEYPQKEIEGISLFFNEIIKKFIYCDNQEIFSEICHIYIMILINSPLEEYFNFFIEENLEDLLFNNLAAAQRHQQREYILQLILIITNGRNKSDVDYLIPLFQRNFIQKLSSSIGNCQNEKILIIYLKIIINFFRIESASLMIASSLFTDIGLRLIHNGGFSAKATAVSYFCKLCKYSKNEYIQSLILKNEIINQLIIFFSANDVKIWNDILEAFYFNAVTAIDSGTDEEDLFEHPLFQSIDPSEFSQFISNILDVYQGFKDSKKEKYKSLYENAIYFNKKI